ncbi:phosphatidylserine decarboxylase [Rhizoctonia solani AG-1 IB]|uniref:Phosphatidylserine decarboxylase proenzyme 2 n=1 Tax=Thanatephorus cucumeris (strain AG1-IB / isolate 7/3/14) TaxID=1108050 RepID=A0A0B7FCC9_THACB|nr:phosphatidylserine decarboxylase [Rhizoctonia solani AG-1 IB]
MAPTNPSTKPTGNKMGIGKVLKNVGKIPKGITSSRSGRTRSKVTQLEGELPAVLLRIQIVGCKDLRAADSNGKSDPFVVVSFAGKRMQTPVIPKTLYPEWAPKDAIFTFPLYFSTIGSQGSIELIIWDKDRFSKNDYLGEVSLPIDDWFKWNGANGAAFDEAQLPFNERILSTDPKNPASGTMQIKIGFVTPPEVNHPIDFQQVYQQLLNHSIMAGLSLDTAPPTRGIGTLGSGDEAEDFDDDGLSSDDEESDDELGPPSPPRTPSDLPAHAPLNVRKDSITQPQAQIQPPQPKPLLPRIFSGVKRPSMSRQDSAASTATNGKPDSNAASTTKAKVPPAALPVEKKKTRRSRKRGSKDKAVDYQLDAGADIQGIVMIEVSSATDLPKLKNVTRTGWDMDPFVVIAFSKKVFRTRVIRHSRTPVWDEKLLFHVRRHETNFKISFSVLDWDKMSGNDHIGDVSLDLPELMKDLPARDPNTGLYPLLAEPTQPELKTFTLDLVPTKEASWEGKHKPTLTIKAKYQPYDALRQRFWRQYLEQYDADNTGLISHIELTSMLDSLGSTLSAETLDGFFSRFNRNPESEELTFDEAVQCLEEELAKPTTDRRKVVAEGPGTGTATPSAPDASMLSPGLGTLDFIGQDARPPPGRSQSKVEQVPHESNQNVIDPNNPTQFANINVSSDEEDSGSASSSNGFERVVNIKTCPLCHRPRLKGKSEADIVTHLAVCASGDWARVDRIVVGNFVTASQAQRKWYTKMLTKITSGDYQLGANSANIIVQNRITGQLEEEKMQGYVRIGIRLLYKGASSRMEGGRARKLLKSMSIKQGQKYDSPESAREIQAFIEFHNLNLEEIKDPLDSFKSFNEFFYRKLKETARPVDKPEDPSRMVSCADCRMMAFETVSEATRLWIKGREFSVNRLLGETYAHEAPKYDGGALGIFRLAPQDYHRFHSPVDGVVGPMTYIAGEYYTVNPQAIRTQLDVYGDNARKIVPIDSPVFGRVMCVCIGAMMVGSIVTTVKEGEPIARGQEFGYFAFGGSTIVLLFEKGKLRWDDDILNNSSSSLETLVRVGMGVGVRST